MNYEQTVELEKNVKIKDQANEIYNSFLNNIKLNANDYVGENKFKLWSDSHNSTFVVIIDSGFRVEFRFLHEAYNIDITPQSIFDRIKSNYRGIDHLRALIIKA